MSSNDKTLHWHTPLGSKHTPAQGIPMYWRYEVTVLPVAVEAYLNNRLHGTLVSQDQIDLIRLYLTQWIDAPAWDYVPSQPLDDLAELRRSVREIKTADDIDRWTFRALDLGIDPL